MLSISIHSLLFILLCSFVARRGEAEDAEALFVFGDSYADTGNRNPYNETLNHSWRRPYGFIWPGYPAGRFSQGKIQTDFWADILGLPSPVAYELLRCGGTYNDIRGGVNFAMAGSGVGKAFGFITAAQQVQQFKNLIAARPEFDSHKLSRSVVLISVAGNDYAALGHSKNASSQGMVNLVQPVVSGIVDVVRVLYECGLRNFVVSNVVPVGCGPGIGKTSCDSIYDEALTLHTKILMESVKRLRSDLSAASILISDLFSAFTHVFSNPTYYGFVDLFTACCGGGGVCGEVDEIGRALFEVCDEADEKFFWDMGHPTQRAWYTIMRLYCYGAETDQGGEQRKMYFVEGASTAMEWVESVGFHAYQLSLQTYGYSHWVDIGGFGHIL